MIRELCILPNNPTMKGQAEMIDHVRYSENGQELRLLLPWAPGGDRSGQHNPCIVFVQGSAWKTPNLNFEIPMLSHFAEEGIAVATVCHRSAAEGYPFPAFLLDVKCAIRFLRANADRYGLDASRIAAFGTSSGGNTVCLLGLTGDDPSLKTEEYAEYSDGVCAVASCFAPTDLPALFDYLSASPDSRMAMIGYFGKDESRWQENMKAYSPVCRVENGKQYPPFLLLHGTADPLVPVQQMEVFYKRLQEADVPADAYYVDNAEHEGNFWSPEVRSVIHDWLCRQLA